jgi:hypothetical protein
MITYPYGFDKISLIFALLSLVYSSQLGKGTFGPEHPGSQERTLDRCPTWMVRSTQAIPFLMLFPRTSMVLVKSPELPTTQSFFGTSAVASACYL